MEEQAQEAWYQTVDEPKGKLLQQCGPQQIFEHLKDEFYKGKENEFVSFKQFKQALTCFIRYWNGKRMQEAIGGHTQEEFRKMTLEA